VTLDFPCLITSLRSGEERGCKGKPTEKKDTEEGRGEDALEGCLITCNISVGIVVYTVAADGHDNW
jgi:hypothetical protein